MSPWEEYNKLGAPRSAHHLSAETPGAQELSSPAPKKDTGLCSTVGMEDLKVPLSSTWTFGADTRLVLLLTFGLGLQDTAEPVHSSVTLIPSKASSFPLGFKHPVQH